MEGNREKVMRKLGRKSYSSFELRLKLKHEIPEIEDIITEFTQKGYLNDADWMVGFIQSEQSKGRGPFAISQRLRAKGFPVEVIENALRGHDPEGALELAIAKKRRKFSDSKKLINSLLRLGFSWDDIKSKLNDVN